MSKKIFNGLVQIYTGSGKGKTTAAFGLAVRAAGAGHKVSIFQFVKGRPYSEDKVLRGIKNITVKKCGRGCFINGKPTKIDIACARKWFKIACDMISRKSHDIFIFDEINIALKFGLISSDNVIKMLEDKPGTVEIVLTGRHCPKSLYKYADLITVMRSLRHPYDRGIQARKGIEY